MFANWMTRIACKVAVMKWAAVALVLVYSALALVPGDQFWLAFVLSTLSNFIHMIIIPYLFSAVADTVDYSLNRWGKGAMAMSYSGHLLALKIGIALGGALSGWILAYVGWGWLSRSVFSTGISPSVADDVAATESGRVVLVRSEVVAATATLIQIRLQLAISAISPVAQLSEPSARSASLAKGPMPGAGICARGAGTMASQAPATQARHHDGQARGLIR